MTRKIKIRLAISKYNKDDTFFQGYYLKDYTNKDDVIVWDHLLDSFGHTYIGSDSDIATLRVLARMHNVDLIVP